MAETDVFKGAKQEAETEVLIPYDDAQVDPDRIVKDPKAKKEKSEGSLKKGKKLFDSLIDGILGVKQEDESVYIPDSVDLSKPPEVPPESLEEGTIVLETYWLVGPYSYVAIVEDCEQNTSYRVYEPLITEKEKLILEETDAELRSIMLYDKNRKSDEIKFEYETVYRIITKLDPSISKKRTGVICYYLERNFHGYGRLDPLMHDENIEDITCNGPDIPLFIYHRKYANLPVNVMFNGEDLNRYVLKIAQKADKQLSLTSPLVDAALPGGARAQITYTDVVSSKGSSFTIRKFKSDPMTPIDLIDYGTYDSEIMAFLWLCVENRKSAIVVGGTASGKTSMMNAFSLFIPQFAKIVSIEDTREIQMPHKNWLPMKTRESTAESGKGTVDMFSLLKAALRQRPEYIIVGEVRGSEAQTLFQAMNTGHTTYSTLHAGGIEQAINRLTTNPINVPPSMFGALNLMIIQQLQYVNKRMARRCIMIAETFVKKNYIDYNILYKWQPAEDKFDKVYKESRVLKEIAYSQGWNAEQTRKEIDKRKEVLEGLLSHRIRDSDHITMVFDEFSKNGYYEFDE
ncbi:MAG: type II/IV secretion system ATPase subunit [Methanomicrobium sp.]|nr:type II/IV secretion system ATPase subunit [Methanomicrobium sp.]